MAAARLVAGLEDAGANEHALGTQVHHQGCVSGGGHAAGGEVDHGQTAVLLDIAQQLHGDLQLLGSLEELIVTQALDAADLGVHGTHVADCLDHVTGARLALGADHGSALGDAAQGLAQVTGTADEGYLELGLVDMIHVVGGRQHFTLVDVVDLNGLQDLGLGEVADAALGHDRDGNGLLDPLDHLGVAHAGHAASRADVSGDPLQRHHGASAGFLGDAGLLRGRDVHDDAALQHLGQFLVQLITIIHSV